MDCFSHYTIIRCWVLHFFSELRLKLLCKLFLKTMCDCWCHVLCGLLGKPSIVLFLVLFLCNIFSFHFLCSLTHTTCPHVRGGAGKLQKIQFYCVSLIQSYGFLPFFPSSNGPGFFAYVDQLGDVSRFTIHLQR